MDLDPSRRLSIDLLTADLDDADDLTALLAVHALEPARLLHGMQRPREDEDDRVTYGNLVQLDATHTAVMHIEEFTPSVALFDPFVRGFILLCRLFPHVIEPEGFENALVLPAHSFFNRSRSIAQQVWGDLACLVGGLLGHNGPPRPQNRALHGEYEPLPNDAGLAELRAIQALLRRAIEPPMTESRYYVREDIGLRQLQPEVAGELDAILRDGARQRLIWFGDEQAGYEQSGENLWREAFVWVDRGVFPTVIPETISAVFALDFVETLRLDRRTALCAHCGRPLLLSPQQVARVDHKLPVYHADCHDEHRRRYVREFQRRSRRTAAKA